MHAAAGMLAAFLMTPWASADAPSESPIVSAWQFSRYDDTVTGHHITMLLLPSDSGKAELMVSCEEQEIIVLADFGQRLSTEDLDVKERLGTAPPVERRWEIAEDSYQILVHPARGAELLHHLAEMEEAGEVELTVTPDGKRPVHATFHMEGLAGELPQLEGCVP